MVAAILNLSPTNFEINILEDHPDGKFNKLFFDGSETEIPSEFNLKAQKCFVYYR